MYLVLYYYFLQAKVSYMIIINRGCMHEMTQVFFSIISGFSLVIPLFFVWNFFDKTTKFHLSNNIVILPKNKKIMSQFRNGHGTL